MVEIVFPRCHCNSCSRETDHDRVDVRTVADNDPESGFWWSDLYETLQCRGCGAVCLRDSYEDASGENQLSYYPPPVSRRAPTWSHQLPSDMRGLVNEIYTALQNNSRRLALMGARTLIDMLALDQVGDVGSFEQKLTALREQGYLVERQRKFLEAALDAGSAAAHRGFNPEPEDLNSVMDVIENVLQSVYHFEGVIERLKKRTPPRQNST